ncbi:C-C motif chemokine 5-like, partial [Sceloporus undulatus]|uniref:C-C motif chemokine 5-like n=1 Tax=Sceloporus undulatus TaxID=8520 RepID=UPI001C4A7A7A
AELPEGDDQPLPGPGFCCTKYTSTKLPLDRVVGYEYANSRCAMPAVIFRTKKNKMVCANPAEKWVQDRINHLPPPK